MRLGKAWVLVVLATVGGALLAPGCGASPASLCEQQCDCVGCSEAELAACIDDAEDVERRAYDRGCGDPYEAYVDCLDAEFQCLDGRVDADGCGPEFGDLLVCSL